MEDFVDDFDDSGGMSKQSGCFNSTKTQGDDNITIYTNYTHISINTLP